MAAAVTARLAQTDRATLRTDVRGLAGRLSTITALCQSVGAGGNLIPDAYVAATAIEHSASVAALDTDFARLPVTVIRPQARIDTSSSAAAN